MCLNNSKCSFGVQEVKFMGFMLTKRGIVANPNKFQAIIDMRSPTIVMEVQHLMRCLVALSRFISCVGDFLFIYLPLGRSKSSMNVYNSVRKHSQG